MQTVDSHIKIALDHYAKEITKQFNCPLFSYTGPIHPQFLAQFQESIEAITASITSPDCAEHITEKRRLCFVISTPGGVVEAVEKMVEITRHHFDEVYFIVPQAAMSAGTILCMAGDKIYMDYASSLGPIDPQVQNPDGVLVPALGYLDKVQELVDKSLQGILSDAELLMLQRLDLATLRRYEQARELSISLLKQWLVKYKFKDWLEHGTTNPGTFVTEAEKITRAEEIAKALSDNNHWHSHGRMIGIERLRKELKLKIEDYTDNQQLKYPLRTYSQLLPEYQERQRLAVFMHGSHC